MSQPLLAALCKGVHYKKKVWYHVNGILVYVIQQMNFSAGYCNRCFKWFSAWLSYAHKLAEVVHFVGFILLVNVLYIKPSDGYKIVSEMGVEFQLVYAKYDAYAKATLKIKSKMSGPC